jgi:diacylglycerol O-acyltransferase / wax synthase
MSAEVAGKQLRGWDAATFRTASGDPTMRSTVVAMAVLDQSPDWERLRFRLERLTLFVPELRMRPLYGVLGVSAPRLSVDPDFDLDFHVRRYRLPENGNWDDVLRDARRISLTDFDHNRPLWEATLIEGLPEGHAAFLLKLHHSIADGQATVMIALTLFELAAEVNPSEPAPPPAPVGEDATWQEIFMANAQDNLSRAVGVFKGLVGTGIGLVKGAVTDFDVTVQKTIETIGSVTRAATVYDSPLSPLLTERGTTYTFGTLEFPFESIRRSAKSQGMSVNDAFMAAVMTGLQAYHQRHGSSADQLRVNVPISLRGDAGDRSGQVSNAVAIARFPIPIAGLGVREIMQEAHDLVAKWRAEPAMRLADPLAEVSWFVPVPMLAQAARASDVTTSNVPGPPIPIYLAGARMIAAYPLVATIGAAVNVTMVTYDGHAFIGVSSDDRAIKDPQELMHDLRAGFHAMTVLADTL